MSHLTPRRPGLPSIEEVKAHAAAHPAKAFKFSNGRWLRQIDNDCEFAFLGVYQGEIVMYTAGCGTNAAICRDQFADSLFTPLAASGLPVDYAEIMDAARVRPMTEIPKGVPVLAIQEGGEPAIALRDGDVVHVGTYDMTATYHVNEDFAEYRGWQPLPPIGGGD